MAGGDPHQPLHKRSADGAELLTFPGERPKQHAATAWRESATSRLGAAQLLAVANRHEPPAAAIIIDEALLPALDPSHRDHERRVEYNNRIQTQNKKNAMQRWYLTLRASTDLYSALAKSCETSAPTLHRTLYEICNMETMYGKALAGYYARTKDGKTDLDTQGPLWAVQEAFWTSTSPSQGPTGVAL